MQANSDLYAVRCSATGQIKIGRSGNVQSRLRGIRAYLRSGSEVVGIVKDCGHIERGIHALLRHRRINREWFQLEVSECLSVFESLSSIRMVKFLGQLALMTKPEFRKLIKTTPEDEFVAMMLSGRLVEMEQHLALTRSSNEESIPCTEERRVEEDMPQRNLSVSFDPRWMAAKRWAIVPKAERTAHAVRMNRARKRKLPAAKRRAIARQAGLASAAKRAETRRIAKESIA